MKHLIKVFLITGLIININQIIAQDWYGQQTIDCTVLLEKKIGDKFIPHGTGFLIYNYKESSKYILVTCEHVLRNKDIYVVYQADSALLQEFTKQGADKIMIGNTRWDLDGENIRAKIELIEGKTFVKHPNLDIAGFKIDIATAMPFLLNESKSLKISDVKGIPKSLILKKQNISLGTEVYFMGFPFMIGTREGFGVPSNMGFIYSGNYRDEVSNPLLRTGTVGWKSEYSKEFLLDALSYGGNSGSPVFTKIGDNYQSTFLIGMVIGHLGESVDIKQKENSKDLDINVQGNSGLARCLWIDDILTVVDKVSLLK